MNFKVPILQKNVRKPQISYGFKAFYALIRILLQLAGCLISQLSRFPRYAVHFFSDIDTRVTRVTFFSTSTIKLKSKNSTRWQQSCHLVEFFGVQHGLWQIPALIKIKRISKSRTRRIILWYSISC